eukprot:scaffold110152_cov29-Tisochrysis_lutea.AAC.3
MPTTKMWRCLTSATNSAVGKPMTPGASPAEPSTDVREGARVVMAWRHACASSHGVDVLINSRRISLMVSMPSLPRLRAREAAAYVVARVCRAVVRPWRRLTLERVREGDWIAVVGRGCSYSKKPSGV